MLSSICHQMAFHHEMCRTAHILPTFAGLGSPVRADHCGSCAPCSGAKWMVSPRGVLENVLTCRPGSIVHTGPHWTLYHMVGCDLALWSSLRLHQGSVQHALLHFSEQASEMALEKHWEADGSWGHWQLEMHFWVNAETTSMQWKDSSILQS